MSLILSGDAGVTFPNSTVQASAGSVLQVVNATYATQVSLTTNTFTDTGLTATITPKFATSKILVIVNQNGCWRTSANPSTCIDLGINKVGTGIVSQFSGALLSTSTTLEQSGSTSATYLDSPATTSAVTYKTQFASRNGTATVYVQYANVSTSYITLMEIAG